MFEVGDNVTCERYGTGQVLAVERQFSAQRDMLAVYHDNVRKLVWYELNGVADLNWADNKRWNLKKL